MSRSLLCVPNDVSIPILERRTAAIIYVQVTVIRNLVIYFCCFQNVDIGSFGLCPWISRFRSVYVLGFVHTQLDFKGDDTTFQVRREARSRGLS